MTDETKKSDPEIAISVVAIILAGLPVVGIDDRELLARSFQLAARIREGDPEVLGQLAFHLPTVDNLLRRLFYMAAVQVKVRTNERIANLLGVSRRSLNNWKVVVKKELRDKLRRRKQ